ncbi:helix-turn-helix transcriptional regulator [Mycolicibacterium sp. J2]|uniref:helix-turn-helix transcriptional regulator n=1 Tax=Mycolicibacterium sp. J2 TaxID=2993511 RepID=UPI00224B60F2|nr:helix-turn-helix transcriptional regulator [Mycolicibacterium sp. J2]MCX2715711.1 helix-turn-helix transcriptional regulator [Mycolicibacterium sp. J2]
MTSARGSDAQLAQFLRSRRAAADTALLPGVVGAGPRRVPGLRREELAEAAGVSLTYYTRLEQGLATNPSTQVLDALARVLALDEVERAHLQRLASATDARPRRGRTGLRPQFVTLMDAMSDVPAVVLSPLQDIIAWNRMGHALLAPHLDPAAPYGGEPPNKVAMMFTDAQSRSMHREWEAEATLAVASLRYFSAAYVAEDDLARLVGNLSVASDDFAQLWAAQPVALCTHGVKRYHHPAVGRLDLHFQILHLPEDDGHRLLLHHAEPGSNDEAALRLLASTTITE